jgi:hypothetical protein
MIYIKDKDKQDSSSKVLDKSKVHWWVLTADFGFLPTTKKTIETKEIKGVNKTHQSPFIK